MYYTGRSLNINATIKHSGHYNRGDYTQICLVHVSTTIIPNIYIYNTKTNARKQWNQQKYTRYMQNLSLLKFPSAKLLRKYSNLFVLTLEVPDQDIYVEEFAHLSIPEGLPQTIPYLI